MLNISTFPKKNKINPVAVEKDVKASFSPVQKLMQYNNQKEVILRIR